MKSFKKYISEDIIGGYHKEQPEYITHGSSKKIQSLDELVSRIGRNYVPALNTDIVQLDDNFDVHLNRHYPSGDFITAHVISRKPGHKGTSLMSYSLMRYSRDSFRAPDGRVFQVFSGTPMKTITNVKKGVFSSPKNLIHTIANHYGVSIMSGGTQTPGGINMWRRAVRHGHESDHSVLRVQDINGNIKSFGPITPRNFSDAYTGDVSTKRTGNKSKVLRGSVRDVISDENAPEEQKSSAIGQNLDFWFTLNKNMKSFIEILLEARPKGKKRYSRDVTKLENLLDRLYSSGVSQKKIDRAEMRLARKTNEGEYDVEDTLKKLEPHLAHDDHSPPAESLEELMMNAARKIYTHRHSHEMVGDDIRSAMGDFLHHSAVVQPNVTNEDLGKEAHRMLINRMNLINKVKGKKRK